MPGVLLLSTRFHGDIGKFETASDAVCGAPSTALQPVPSAQISASEGSARVCPEPSKYRAQILCLAPLLCVLRPVSQLKLLAQTSQYHHWSGPPLQPGKRGCRAFCSTAWSGAGLFRIWPAKHHHRFQQAPQTRMPKCVIELRLPVVGLGSHRKDRRCPQSSGSAGSGRRGPNTVGPAVSRVLVLRNKWTARRLQQWRLKEPFISLTDASEPHSSITSGRFVRVVCQCQRAEPGSNIFTACIALLKTKE
eukprot:CAMPEP_0171139678 /NCGR_PEP_ID=MMETSP0766_2-20121228/137310_1 /TAXON_ID=439317 /ORGANISM="Gambierdiscus australes, Strain CAWD 149" /LENGTH=248 /DNA_ID=CAMNT_0011603343 /DNA_START=302 /DNA_END=1047 /DNA_ORIENTATION=+